MTKTNTYVQLAFFMFISWTTQAQCEIFKSEINEVQEFMQVVSQLTDSLRPASEIAAFDAQFSKARTHAKQVEFLMGKAVTAAYEATKMVADAQYDSQNCGEADAISFTIDAENHAIDARDFADEAYQNAKSASAAKNLGNLQYHMRKAQRIIREAQKSADASSYAAEIAHYSCKHVSESD
jgi:hypothetical protein